MLEIFSEVDFPFFVIFRIISFQTIWWGAFFSSFCSRKRAEDIFWRPPVADWKETELTDRAHTVCPRGAGLKKKKRDEEEEEPFSLSWGCTTRGWEVISPRNPRGKRGFCVQTGHKVVRKKKDGAAFLVNRHLPRHIYKKKKKKKKKRFLLLPELPPLVPSSLFPEIIEFTNHWTLNLF